MAGAIIVPGILIAALATGCRFDPSGLAPDDHPVADSGAAADSAAAVDGPAADAAEPVVHRLPALGDTFLRQQFPTDNYGGASVLRSGSGSSADRANRSILRFETASVGACSVHQARLSLYYADEDFRDQSPVLAVHRVTAPWSEEVASWSHRATDETWGTPGGDFDDAPEDSVIAEAGAFGWLSWELTSLVDRWLSREVDDHGVIVLEPEDAGGDRGRKVFESSEGAEQLAPYLEIHCLPPVR